MKRIDLVTFVAAFGAALIAPVCLQAQDSRLFVTSTDEQFVEADFGQGTSRVAGSVAGADFHGLAVRSVGDQLRVLVSSSSHGGRVYIFDPDSGSLAGAVVAERLGCEAEGGSDDSTSGGEKSGDDGIFSSRWRNPEGDTKDDDDGEEDDTECGLGGLTVDGAGNVFVAALGHGSTAVWAIPIDSSCDPSAMVASGSCRPGGYAAPVQLASSLPGAVTLADLKVIPYMGSGLVGGDLLVAASSPGRLYCVPNPLAGTAATHCSLGVFSDALAGFEPTGLAFAPNGDVLVSVRQGDVRVLSPANAPSSASFTGGTPGNATGISLGHPFDDFEVLVATQNGGAVHRYDLAGDALGVVDATVDAPEGLGSLIATLGAPTPAGANQTVRTTADEITFDLVTEPGVTSMQAFVFDDPRPGVNGDPSQPLSQDLHVKDIPGLPADVPDDLIIPAFFRPRTAGDRKVIVLFRGRTTAAIAGTINHHIFEHFGADAECGLAESWLQPRLLWARDTGGTMEDITSGCGSDVGRAYRFSWFALAHDTRSLQDTLEAKLTALGEAGSCLGKKSQRGLRRAISRAERLTRRESHSRHEKHGRGGGYCSVQSALERLIDDLDATAGTCEAEVEARAVSAAYTASLLCH